MEDYINSILEYLFMPRGMPLDVIWVYVFAYGFTAFGVLMAIYSGIKKWDAKKAFKVIRPAGVVFVIAFFYIVVKLPLLTGVIVAMLALISTYWYERGLSALIHTASKAKQSLRHRQDK